MASARVVAVRPGPAHPRPSLGGGRQVLLIVGFIVVVALLWEGLKFLGGVPWRAIGTGPSGPVIHNPPFRWPFVNDLNLPHIWNIALVLFQPFQRGSTDRHQPSRPRAHCQVV